ncbi:MAG: phage portal protein [Pseudobdellovibrionaceae bacterium]|nr:phage portal protein [Pseudobdellovibrionaceae bacterium]
MTEYIKSPAGILLPAVIAAADSPYRSASALNRAVREWFPSFGDADEALLPSLATLRAQSRDLDRNEAIARGATENIVGNVVADGLRPQAKLDHEYLGISETQARSFERAAEKIYELHANSIHADFRLLNPLPLSQALAMRSVLLDGDCLVVRRFRPRPGGILGTCVQVIEGARLENPFDQSRTADIREGVELDDDGVPEAYHVRVGNSGRVLSEESKVVRIPRFDAQNRIQVLHLYNGRLPGQTRGEPILAPVVEKFKQLGRYTDAEIMAAVISAFFSVFVTSDNEGPFGRKAEAHLATRKGTNPERSTQTFGNGLMVNLLPGEKVESVTPGRPNSGFDPFVQAILRQVGIAIGLPYEVLVQHFQSSYSASRAAILEAWKFFKLRRSWLVRSYCQPVYEWIIEEAVLRGLLSAPRFDDPIKRQIYLSTEWIGATMQSIDPLKDAKADEIRLKSGVASRRSIVEEQGRDYEKLRREIENELEHIVPQEPDSKDDSGAKNA